MTILSKSSPHGPWAGYLRAFHAERPGITERILRRCRADGLDPYQWCAQPLAAVPGAVLDLACGSGPLADHLAGWIGVDTSAAELSGARDRGRGPLVLASAAGLSVRTAGLDGVVCSMGMQIIDPFGAALAELARVMRADGTAVLLVPAGGPVPWRDALVFVRLQIALRGRIHYPNDHLLRPAALRDRAARVSLAITADERRAFVLPLTTSADAEDLLASLYLPTVDAGRLEAARRVLLGQVGRELAVPLRRIIVDRSSAAVLDPHPRERRRATRRHP